MSNTKQSPEANGNGDPTEQINRLHHTFTETFKSSYENNKDASIYKIDSDLKSSKFIRQINASVCFGAAIIG